MKAISKEKVMLLVSTLCFWAVADETKPTALGLAEGQSPPIGGVVVANVGGLKAVKLPPVAGMDDLLALYTDEQGICKVVGMKNVENYRGDSYGIAHKREADKLADRVTKKLGSEPTTVFDFNSDSLFDEPEDWLFALRRGNARYSFFWEDDSASPFYGVNILTSTSYVMVSFEFKNFKQCVAAKEAAHDAEF